jgi:formate dehydrogenase iron-sulfur subunit
MTTRYAFSVDLDRCIGCQACVVGCHAGNELGAGEAYIAINDIVRGKTPDFWGSFSHNRCFHCADAPCVAVCPTGTLAKWNGLTTVSVEKCSACSYCTDACPFHVPHIYNNHVSKCQACLELVQAGETPWCAQTCPSQAIRFGDREAILTEAKARVADLKPRYPTAQVYGETQLGGLGLLMVLLDEPAVYGLPENPLPPALQAAWQQVVQPASATLSAVAAGVMGMLFFFARRRHAVEHAQLHAAAGAASGKQEAKHD